LNTQEEEGPNLSILIAAKVTMMPHVATAVVALFAALPVGAPACINLWLSPDAALLRPEGFKATRGTVFPIAFGTIFAVVSVLHFVCVDNCAVIVPPHGSLQVMLPGKDPPKTVVHLQNADKVAVRKEEGLDSATIEALRKALPSSDTYLVTSYIKWYDYFAQHFHLKHPKW
jgi:hypothetical protein